MYLTKRMISLVIVLLLAGFLGGCAAQAAEEPAAPTATAEPEAPAAVIAARDAVLDYLREGANECVPPPLATWHARDLAASTPDGFTAYRFESERCAITVTYEGAGTGTDDTLYHVHIGEREGTGFCWQAVVNARGTVKKTGSAAANDEGPGNPAATFCTAQGYEYGVITREDGTQCGVCAFPDGSACNSWDYFLGACEPGKRWATALERKHACARPGGLAADLWDGSNAFGEKRRKGVPAAPAAGKTASEPPGARAHMTTS